MSLSIIIPYDSSSLEDLNTSLTVIDNQLKMDWSSKKVEIILVHDENTADIDTSVYPQIGNYISQISYEGTDAARKQYALTFSSNDYVIFLPTNICFYSMVSISDILEVIKRNPRDLYFFGVVDGERRDSSNEQQIRDQKNDLIGKAFSRSFIENTGLSFYSHLPCYEDITFAKMALANHPQYQYSKAPTFIMMHSVADISYIKYVYSHLDGEFAAMATAARKDNFRTQREIVSLCYSVYCNLSKTDDQDLKQKITNLLASYILTLSETIVLKDVFRLNFSGLNITYTNLDGEITFEEFMHKVLEAVNE